IEYAAELNVPVSLPYREAGKWKYYRSRSKDWSSTERFAKYVRDMMGTINLYDNPWKSGTPRITDLKDIEDIQPGDLILYDLRYQKNPDYRGHTRTLVEIDEDVWLWPYGVVEGHMGGAAAEESWYAMNGWIWGIANQWRGPADEKARTWNCQTF
ncbi:MAG: hypothetical protein GY801_49465, partial [bacterium]|nr:hypothetical protein [bacterium]